MKINKYCVVWTDDNGEGRIINYEGSCGYKLYKIDKQVMIDFFGDTDIDVLFREEVLFESSTIQDFKMKVRDDFVLGYVQFNVEAEPIKIYKSMNGEFFYYNNNQKTILYSPTDMKKRADRNFNNKYKLGGQS